MYILEKNKIYAIAGPYSATQPYLSNIEYKSNPSILPLYFFCKTELRVCEADPHLADFYTRDRKFPY